MSAALEENGLFQFPTITRNTVRLVVQGKPCHQDSQQERKYSHILITMSNKSTTLGYPQAPSDLQIMARNEINKISQQLCH